MTTRRAIVAAVVSLVVALVIWYNRSGTASAPAASPGLGSPPSRTLNSKPQTAAPVAASEPSTLADALNSPATDIRADLRVVSEIIDTFRTNFPRDGNPVGTNAEITAALTGRNKLKLALIPPKHPAINRAGEICDRWGTPFFFHAEAANKMEIRSAGPDRKMWNADDVTFTP